MEAVGTLSRFPRTARIVRGRYPMQQVAMAHPSARVGHGALILGHAEGGGATERRGDRARSRSGSSAAPPGGNGRPLGPWRVAAALVALALIALVVAPYLDRDERGEGQPRHARVADILVDPDAFADTLVAVVGEVEAAVEPRSFTLRDAGGEGAAQLTGALLVVIRGPLPRGRDDPTGSAPRAGDALQVVGPVRRFRVADIERESGGDLDDVALLPWADQPVLVATAVTLLGITPSVPEPAPAPARGATGTRPASRSTEWLWLYRGSRSRSSPAAASSSRVSGRGGAASPPLAGVFGRRAHGNCGGRGLAERARPHPIAAVATMNRSAALPRRALSARRANRHADRRGGDTSRAWTSWRCSTSSHPRPSCAGPPSRSRRRGRRGGPPGAPPRSRP